MGVATKTKQEALEAAQPLAQNLGWLLSRAAHVLHTEMTAALEDIGITPRSFCLLSSAMAGEYTQIELAHAVGLDKTTMVVTLDELEESGLAKREPSSHDRRARVVKVTKAGERRVAEAEGIVRRLQQEVLDDLPAGERKALLDSLSRLVSERLSTPAECGKPVRRRV
ncbi:MAG: MarR family winged helix-turn-helix transcriptional regulator [Solirubrobacterales bacterium]